ncbi:tetratricopeptide repeat protein, partial [Kaarinaea lacus]
MLAAALLVLLIHGCASTPDITPLPTPDISSSAQINDNIRRPVPVYEFPATPPEGDQAEIIPQQEVLEAPPTYSNEATSSSRTVVVLLDQASKQAQSGSPERAAATLERALRIEPKNARLWHRLAIIRYQQGKYSLAESLAAKSSTLAQGDWSLKKRNAE